MEFGIDVDVENVAFYNFTLYNLNPHEDLSKITTKSCMDKILVM